MSREISFQDPWCKVQQHSDNLECELLKEVSNRHPLYGCRATPLAQRSDSDDVLFEITGAQSPYAVVHLTWSGETESDPRWPHTIFFDSIDAWVEECMLPDHEEYDSLEEAE